MADAPDMSTLLYQSLSQLNANLRNAADSATVQIHGFYKETKRLLKLFEDRKGFGIRPATISPTITITTGSGSSTDIKISEGEDFIVFEVRGFLSFNNWSAEPLITVGAGFGGFDGPVLGSTSPLNRAYIKASNAKINLQNKDTKVPITDTNDLVLSSILAELGAPPLRYGGEARPSWIIPHGTTITTKVTLSSTIAQIIGASSDYGLAISGVYLSR